MSGIRQRAKKHPRLGATVVLATMCVVLLLGMVAFAVDVGYIMLVRTQLQVAADSSAMAAAASMGLRRDEMLTVAEEYAGYHGAGGREVDLNSDDVEYGIWDAEMRRFTPIESPGNAIRVTARADENTGGKSSLFFGNIFSKFEFSSKASAVAMANPRDIAFVVDLSGSMNDDTEPCWATGAINKAFTPDGYPTVGNKLMQQLFDDLGFGSYPGVVEYIGQPTGVAANTLAYAMLIENGGPLTGRNVPLKYRIDTRDTRVTRKRKAYSYMIDYQIARIMPNVRPAPSSSANYEYWEKYLDYIIYAVRNGPPNQDRDRIHGFNNPKVRLVQ